MELKKQECIEFIIKRLGSLDVPYEHAKDVANVLIEAELREDPSHGISCLLKIINAIKNKEIIPSKNTKIIKQEKATAVLDAENVLGPVAGIKAMDFAVEKAKEYGIAAVSLRKSHHLFSIGYYAKIATLNDMMGIVTTSTAPAIFAPGGLEKVLGTNPIAIGIPTNQYPIILDMSSTKVARGKIREAIKSEKEIPLTWALDKQGNSTQDPKKALEGALQPIGGYKGFGLALAIDVLSGILSGSASGKEVYGTSMHANEKNQEIAYKGDLFIAMDISKFLELEIFKSKVSKLVSNIKNSEKLERVGEIYIPGEKVYKNQNNLIQISDKLYQEF